MLTFCFNHGLLFWGEQFIPSGLAAVLQATIPGFGLLVAPWLLPAERPTPRKVLGVGIGLAGVAGIFAHELHAGSRAAAWGSAAVVFAAASVATGNVLVKSRGAHLPPAAMAAWQMVFGFIPLLAVGLWREGSPLALHWTPAAVGCLLYLAVVGSAVAFYLYYWLTARAPVTSVMTVALVTPVSAVLLGWLILGETLSWRTALGAAAVLAGTTLVIRPARHRPGKDQAPNAGTIPLGRTGNPNPMTPDERNLITGLFNRLRQADGAVGNKDVEALQLIQQQTTALPSAPYLLVQTLLVQEHALTNAQTRIADLERQVAAARSQPDQGHEPEGGGSFLGNLIKKATGGSSPQPPPLPTQAQSPGVRQPSAAPALCPARSWPTRRWLRLPGSASAPGHALPDDEHDGALGRRQLPEICVGHGRGRGRRGHAVPGHPKLDGS